MQNLQNDKSPGAMSHQRVFHASCDSDDHDGIFEAIKAIARDTSFQSSNGDNEVNDRELDMENTSQTHQEPSLQRESYFPISNEKDATPKSKNERAVIVSSDSIDTELNKAEQNSTSCGSPITIQNEKLNPYFTVNDTINASGPSSKRPALFSSWDQEFNSKTSNFLHLLQPVKAQKNLLSQSIPTTLSNENLLFDNENVDTDEHSSTGKQILEQLKLNSPNTLGTGNSSISSSEDESPRSADSTHSQNHQNIGCYDHNGCLGDEILLPSIDSPSQSSKHSENKMSQHRQNTTRATLSEQLSNPNFIETPQHGELDLGTDVSRTSSFSASPDPDDDVEFSDTKITRLSDSLLKQLAAAAAAMSQVDEDDCDEDLQGDFRSDNGLQQSAEQRKERFPPPPVGKLDDPEHYGINLTIGGELVKSSDVDVWEFPDATKLRELRDRLVQFMSENHLKQADICRFTGLGAPYLSFMVKDPTISNFSSKRRVEVYSVLKTFFQKIDREEVTLDDIARLVLLSKATARAANSRKRNSGGALTPGNEKPGGVRRRRRGRPRTLERIREESTLLGNLGDDDSFNFEDFIAGASSSSPVSIHGDSWSNALRPSATSININNKNLVNNNLGEASFPTTLNVDGSSQRKRGRGGRMRSTGRIGFGDDFGLLASGLDDLRQRWNLLPQPCSASGEKLGTPSKTVTNETDALVQSLIPLISHCNISQLLHLDELLQNPSLQRLINAALTLSVPTNNDTTFTTRTQDLPSHTECDPPQDKSKPTTNSLDPLATRNLPSQSESTDDDSSQTSLFNALVQSLLQNNFSACTPTFGSDTKLIESSLTPTDSSEKKDLIHHVNNDITSEDKTFLTQQGDITIKAGQEQFPIPSATIDLNLPAAETNIQSLDDRQSLLTTTTTTTKVQDSNVIPHKLNNNNSSTKASSSIINENVATAAAVAALLSVATASRSSPHIQLMQQSPPSSVEDHHYITQGKNTSKNELDSCISFSTSIEGQQPQQRQVRSQVAKPIVLTPERVPPILSLLRPRISTTTTSSPIVSSSAAPVISDDMKCKYNTTLHNPSLISATTSPITSSHLIINDDDHPNDTNEELIQLKTSQPSTIIHIPSSSSSSSSIPMQHVSSSLSLGPLIQTILDVSTGSSSCCGKLSDDPTKRILSTTSSHESSSSSMLPLMENPTTAATMTIQQQSSRSSSIGLHSFDKIDEINSSITTTTTTNAGRNEQHYNNRQECVRFGKGWWREVDVGVISDHYDPSYNNPITYHHDRITTTHNNYDYHNDIIEDSASSTRPCTDDECEERPKRPFLALPKSGKVYPIRLRWKYETLSGDEDIIWDATESGTAIEAFIEAYVREMQLPNDPVGHQLVTSFREQLESHQSFDNVFAAITQHLASRLKHKRPRFLPGMTRKILLDCYRHGTRIVDAISWNLLNSTQDAHDLLKGLIHDMNLPSSFISTMFPAFIRAVIKEKLKFIHECGELLLENVQNEIITQNALDLKLVTSNNNNNNNNKKRIASESSIMKEEEFDVSSFNIYRSQAADHTSLKRARYTQQQQQQHQAEEVAATSEATGKGGEEEKESTDISLNSSLPAIVPLSYPAEVLSTPVHVDNTSAENIITTPPLHCPHLEFDEINSHSKVENINVINDKDIKNDHDREMDNINAHMKEEDDEDRRNTEERDDDDDEDEEEEDDEEDDEEEDGVDPSMLSSNDSNNNSKLLESPLFLSRKENNNNSLLYSPRSFSQGGSNTLSETNNTSLLVPKRTTDDELNKSINNDRIECNNNNNNKTLSAFSCTLTTEQEGKAKLSIESQLVTQNFDKTNLISLNPSSTLSSMIDDEAIKLKEKIDDNNINADFSTSFAPSNVTSYNIDDQEDFHLSSKSNIATTPSKPKSTTLVSGPLSTASNSWARTSPLASACSSLTTTAIELESNEKIIQSSSITQPPELPYESVNTTTDPINNKSHHSVSVVAKEDSQYTSTINSDDISTLMRRIESDGPMILRHAPPGAINHTALKEALNSNGFFSSDWMKHDEQQQESALDSSLLKDKKNNHNAFLDNRRPKRATTAAGADNITALRF